MSAGLIEPDVLADLCSLVMKHPPSPEAIAGWTVQQVTEVENWAALEHLRASDCIVPAVERPAILDAEAAP